MEFHLLLFFLIAIASGFEVELIHRDSPLSPLFNQSSQAGLNQSEESVESNVIGGARGDYLMAFLIGTPPIKTYAAMDTGSDLIWIQCPPCINCFPQNTSFFEPKMSSTYKKVKCGSPICGTNCSFTTSEECPYRYEYADGSITSGILATDTFAFQKTTATDVLFGCGNDNWGTFSGGGSGIVGLGWGSLSLISQLGKQLEQRFSYCLPRSPEISSSFKFGVKANFRAGKVLSIPIIKDDTYPTYYYVKLDGISVGNKKIASKNVVSVKKNTIVDSGTTLNLLEPEIYYNFIATTKEIIGLPTVRDLIHSYDLCYPTQSLKNISVPKFTYHFSGADIELKDLNVLIAFQEITCIAVAPSHTDFFNVYGNVAQKNFEVEYNLESKIISFAPADCSWKGAAAGRIQTDSFIPSTSFCIFLVFLLVF